MEQFDLLHVVWLGIARELVASVMLDMVEFGVPEIRADTWDAGLSTLHLKLAEWCRQRGIRQSTVEELSVLAC